jgi:alkaline phosphatase
MKNLFLLLMMVSFVSFGQEKKPKNVILLIGDGMGLSQLSTAFYFEPESEPNFAKFPVVGLINTSSAKQKITDSAAGATAFACGQKSYNGAISVDTNEAPLPTLVEKVEKQGIMTGLIATSSITHATPACFYAHQPSRSMQDEIAEELVESGVDFFAGGGLKYFNQRVDKKDVYTMLLKKGYVLDTNKLDATTQLDISKKYGFILASGGLDSKLEGRGDFLMEATSLGISYLSQSSKGFFMMVEGSQIDWEGHAANSDGIIQEVRDFDKAVGVALDFAKKNGETLVIVTADHETGGYALSPGSGEDGWEYNNIQPTFYEGATSQSYAAHTTTLIPVLAYGPKSSSFAGFYQNSDIYHKIMNATVWNQTISSKDVQMNPFR